MAKWIPQVGEEVILKKQPFFKWHGAPESRATITSIYDNSIIFQYNEDKYIGNVNTRDILRDWELLSSKKGSQR